MGGKWDIVPEVAATSCILPCPEAVKFSSLLGGGPDGAICGGQWEYQMVVCEKIWDQGSLPNELEKKEMITKNISPTQKWMGDELRVFFLIQVKNPPCKFLWTYTSVKTPVVNILKDLYCTNLSYLHVEFCSIKCNKQQPIDKKIPGKVIHKARGKCYNQKKIRRYQQEPFTWIVSYRGISIVLIVIVCLYHFYCLLQYSPLKVCQTTAACSKAGLNFN